MGISSCRGFCKPIKSPSWSVERYRDHVFCRVCNSWALKTSVWKKVFCPCCHTRVSWKPKSRKNRIKYNIKSKEHSVIQ